MARLALTAYPLGVAKILPDLGRKGDLPAFFGLVYYGLDSIHEISLNLFEFK